MRERNHTFDFLCGICIIRMIMLHIITFCGHKNDDWWSEVMAWSFFFMCFFFFKAGYFNKTVAGNTKAFIADKAKRLLIPYVIWGLIGFAVYAFFLPFEIKRYHHPIEPMYWSHLWSTSAVWGNEPMWFLFSFFSCYVVVHLIKKIHIVKPISVFQTLIVLACPFLSYWMWTLDNPLPMSLSNVFMGVFFFNLGRVWRWIIDRVGRQVALSISIFLIALFIVLNIIWHGEYIMHANKFVGNEWAAFTNTVIILLGLSGFLIKLPLKRVPVINYIGQHSMVFFVAHYPILQFYRFTHIVFGRSIYGRIDDIIILTFFVFPLCVWLVPYVEKVPWLSGRWKKEKTKSEQQ
ncbi:MAG: acyltransferase [Bacteroidales bacterium]|nr:acyltransferase [Bacteroidales bacterium]